MRQFEWLQGLLLAAVLLTALARRVKLPYPSLLALGGVGLALLPWAPPLSLNPQLVLALFVAPVLLDSAYDSSLRDLRENWIPVTALVLAAVSVTTLAVAFVARQLIPDLPWAAAIALGAIVAPPDAAAATAVLRQMKPPHRILVILEGESMLNDASALLIYRLAVGAVVTERFSPGHILPTLLLMTAGSALMGVVLSKLYMKFASSFHDAPTSIVLQFVGTFGVWMLAERLHLSGVITIVAYAITLAQRAPDRVSAQMRIPSYAVWETVVFVLNLIAFVMIGLQLRPILESFPGHERVHALTISGLVLATVVGVRLVWVMGYNVLIRWRWRTEGRKQTGRRDTPPTAGSGLVIAWCGMRGIVTLAAAYALPEAFPHRGLVVLCAFGVVVGTLVVQGFTLGPLMARLKLQDDAPMDREVKLARSALAEAAVKILDGDTSFEAEALRRELGADQSLDLDSREDPVEQRVETLRKQVVAAQRQSLSALRSQGEIGDDAFHLMVEHLDWLELGSGPPTS